MKTEQFINKKEFLFWLKSIASGTIVSITLIGGTYEAIYTSVHPKALSQIHKLSEGFLGEGKYIVTYDKTELEETDLEYSKYAMAITFEVSLANSRTGAKTGGLSFLKEQLSDYEHCIRMDKDSRFQIGHIWVKIPSSSVELESLKNILAKESVYYAFPDDAGEIHSGNLRKGGGVRLYS